MGVTVSNLTQGPGSLSIAAVGVTEPVDASTALDAGYTDLGGTQGGVMLSVNQTYKELEVDQVVDVPGRRVTKRDMTIKTNLAEPTLANLAYSLNAPLPAAATGTAPNKTQFFEPVTDTSATQPLYRALCFTGFAPGSDATGNAPARRVLVRRALSTDNVDFAYKKDDQTVFSVTWSAHYVSGSIKPFKVLDQQFT
jgi:hypothetical protein